MCASVTDQLQPHQVTGSRFLADRPFAMLADEAGAGKTATSVTACDLAGAKRVLVLCPAVVRPHWSREFARWQRIPRDIAVVDGSPTSAPASGVTILSHASIVKPAVLQLLMSVDYDAVLVDEGGEFRNFDAARTRHLYGRAPHVSSTDPYQEAIWSRARHVWHLSATPITNSAADLYPLWSGPLAGLTALGRPDWYDFAAYFTDLKSDGMNGVKPVGLKHAAELRSHLAPWLRRRIVDVGVPLAIEEVPLPVPSEAITQVIAGLEGWGMERLTTVLLSGEEPRDSEISRVRRALGVAMAPHVVAWARDVLERGAGPLVIFFYHQDVKKALHEGLRDRWRVSWIDGGITRKQLVAAESWFQDGRLDVLLVQIQAGGMGITLTRSNLAVMAELPWTAAAAWQAIKRVHRIGQTRPCWGAVMTCDCWLMRVMLSVLSRKKTMSEELLAPLVET